MAKNKIMLIMAAITLVFSITVIGCGGDDESDLDPALYGTWTWTMSDTSFETYTFKSDGTFTYENEWSAEEDGGIGTGTWTADGSQLTAVGDRGQDKIPYSFQNGDLYFHYGEFFESESLQQGPYKKK